MYLWLQTWLILGIFVEFHCGITFHFPLVLVQVFMVVPKFPFLNLFGYDFSSHQITSDFKKNKSGH